MTSADNTRHLLHAAAARHDSATRRAHDALEHLDRTGQPITFQAVARTAKVSRGWLYRQPDLRAAIVRLRSTSPDQPSLPGAQRASIDSLRQRLDTTRDEITRLRAENNVLRDQLARSLGKQRAPR
jgi:hypothetical protein